MVKEFFVVLVIIISAEIAFKFTRCCLRLPTSLRSLSHSKFPEGIYSDSRWSRERQLSSADLHIWEGLYQQSLHSGLVIVNWERSLPRVFPGDVNPPVAFDLLLCVSL